MSRILAAAEALSAELDRPEPRLDHVALAIAGLDPVPFDAAASIRTLDAWAARVVADAEGEPGYRDMQRVLGDELGLVGDRQDYDAPENSFLPRALVRRRGLPILLSLIWIEVGRRAGVSCFGVGLPGHFVVGCQHPEEGLVVVDAFAGGAVLSRAEVETMVDRAGASFAEAMLRATTPRAIAVRMIRNLVASFLRRGRIQDARAASQLWEAASPGDPASAELFAELDRRSGTVWS